MERLRVRIGHHQHLPTVVDQATHPPGEVSTEIKSCPAMKEYLIAGFCIVALSYEAAITYYREYCLNANA